MYNRVDEGVIAALARIVGEGNVLAGPQHAEMLEPYTHDETVGLAADPEVVVLVTSAQQVSDIMRLAQAARCRFAAASCSRWSG
jgi:FAD/FMN-containing dehydrogenase